MYMSDLQRICSDFVMRFGRMGVQELTLESRMFDQFFQALPWRAAEINRKDDGGQEIDRIEVPVHDGSVFVKRGYKRSEPRANDDGLRFSHNLRALVLRADVSMRSLSKETGVPESTLSGYVNGAEPGKMGHIRALCKFFVVSFEDILYGELG